MRPGYKQTEAGVIPEEWEALPLGRLIKLQAGYSFRSENFSDLGIPVIRISDLQEGSVKVEEAICHPPFKISDDFVIRNGDILVAMSGATTGKVGVFRSSKPAYQNQRVGRFVVLDKERTSQDFVGQIVRSSQFGWRLSVLLEQGAQPNVSGRQIESLVFPVPSALPEQRAIAEALSDVDALLGALDRLIAKKRDLKQAAMQQLLTGQTRLPGFGTRAASRQHTTFGEFPDDWDVMPLSRVCAFITKGSTPTTYGFDWVSYGVLFLRSECVSEQGMNLSESMFITPEAHQLLRRSEVRAGDLLMTITGNVGRVVYLERDFPPSNINQHIARIRIVDDQISAAYVFHFLSQPLVRKYYNQITTGQAYPQISLTQVRSTALPIPTLPEQIAIAEVLSDMDAELAALEQHRDKTRALKQGMMQELLTGRIRLVGPQAAAPV